MSLTEAESVYGAIHENALNDLLQAFCVSRPRHLTYGTPAFVPTTTVNETRIDAIPFPGIPGGIQWRIRLSIPKVDLFTQSTPLPPELSLTKDHFSAAVGVDLCISCSKLGIGAEANKPSHEGTSQTISEMSCCRLQVFAIGHIQRVFASNGEDAVTLAIDKIELVDVTPPGLESLLECFLFMILQSALANIQLPLRALRAGAFQLALTQGPFVDEDQIKIRGTVRA